MRIKFKINNDEINEKLNNSSDLKLTINSLRKLNSNYLYLLNNNKNIKASHINLLFMNKLIPKIKNDEIRCKSFDIMMSRINYKKGVEFLIPDYVLNDKYIAIHSRHSNILKTKLKNVTIKPGYNIGPMGVDKDSQGSITLTNVTVTYKE